MISVVVIEAVRQRAVKKCRVTAGGFNIHAPHRAIAGSDIHSGKLAHAIADFLCRGQYRNTETVEDGQLGVVDDRRGACASRKCA